MDKNHAVNPTRGALQRVATHVLARARFLSTGKFGLRATPGGFGTPAFGADVEVLRVSGLSLVRERAGRASATPLHGSTLDQLAAFVDTDLAAPFDVGPDTPDLGDPSQPLALDGPTAYVLAGWWELGVQVLDSVIAAAPDAMAVQLWPEHFDVGTSVAVGDGETARCNLGASPGDTSTDEPYLYVGPWTAERPGDASYWNAPFGAAVTRSQLMATDDPLAAGVAFARRGVELLS